MHACMHVNFFKGLYSCFTAIYKYHTYFNFITSFLDSLFSFCFSFLFQNGIPKLTLYYFNTPKVKFRGRRVSSVLTKGGKATHENAK